MINQIQNPLHHAPIKLSDKVSVDDRKYIPKQYQEVAEGMEAQFAQYMIEQMRKSVDSAESEEDSSTAKDLYNSMLDSERAKTMAQKGLGVQDVILNQIYPKRLRNEITYRQMSGEIHQKK